MSNYKAETIDKIIYAVNVAGPATDTVLLTPGSTVNDHELDRWCKIHLHEVDLFIDAAGTVTIKIGNQEVYKRTLTVAGEVHSVDRDLYVNDATLRSLTISVSAGATVTGQIRYSREFSGGPQSRTWEDGINNQS